jgi:diguanylate cyclase (GGDEF)-like protein/PAS domain S-box-containing protein
VARILIVDDDPTGRELLVTLARHSGHEPLEAADGAEALECVRAHKPQIVISDILMPTMDGYEFVRRLRSEKELADTNVIFYTANYHEKEALKLAESGQVARVLIKPCEPTELLHAIEAVIKGENKTIREQVPAEFDHQHLKLLTDKLWRRTTELERANSKLAALTDLHVQLASERDPHALLRQVCISARNLFGAKYAVLAARGKAGNGHTFFAVSGLDAAERQAEMPALNAGALGRVLATREAWRISRDDGATIDAGLPKGYPRARAFLAVPIVSLTQAYGWICLADKIGAAGFTDDDERLFANLGAQVGRIYENDSLNQELQHRAQQLQEEIVQRERALVALRASEERFRQLAENIHDVFFVASSDLNELIYLSPAYSQIWGQSGSEAANCAEMLMKAIHPDDLKRIRAEFSRVAAGAIKAEFEYRIQRPDQATRWIQVRTFPVMDSDAVGKRVVGTATDVTDGHVSAARIEHLNRVYAVLSSINALIVRVRERDELFRESCRLAVQFGRFAVAWIGWLDPETGRIPSVAWAGARPDVLQSACPIMGPDPRDDGIVADAVRSGEPRYANDVKTDPQRIMFREELLQQGYRGMIALPLTVDGKPAGCLVLVTEEAGFFSDEERHLLVKLADDISFAFDHLVKADRLHSLAYYDGLTGLANRTLFLDRLGQHLAIAARTGKKMALIAMAPERLSNINDTFGRPAGDLVLKQFSERFAEAVGKDCDIGRVSGDQIATLVDALDGDSEVIVKVSRWQEECFGSPFDVHGTQMRLGATTGIAMYPEDGDNAEALLKNCEAALERAKSTGDAHLFYTQRFSVAITEKLMLENALREALERKEFQLYYQPKVDIETRHVKGVEALIRWNSAERGLVPPIQFIPLMEETGMIVPVGAWVIRQAAEERAQWLSKGIIAPRVAVNVSTVQLRKRDFVQTVRAALQDAGKAPGIDFEVTESLIMDDVEGNIRKLEEISRMGIGIALDDFGTGYSSLGYLAKLPVETLKIDRSFIARMLDDPGAMTLVSTMISLAHSLSLTVVAEGVETEEQAKILRLLRCDEIQGYLISKPIPFEAMTEFLQQSRS